MYVDDYDNGDMISVYGIYFCGNCKNMMKPLGSTENVNILQFNCDGCREKQTVNFEKREGKECMLYSKELHGGSKKFQPDTVYVLDPTMPRLKARCPNCDYEEAVYFLIPDEGERKIVTKLICARQAEDTKMVICGEVWDLPDGDKIDKYHVIAQPNNGLF